MESGQCVKQTTNNWRVLFVTGQCQSLFVTMATGSPNLRHCYQQILKSHLQYLFKWYHLISPCALQTHPLTPGCFLHRDNLQ